jgi:hypothetical protein
VKTQGQISDVTAYEDGVPVHNERQMALCDTLGAHGGEVHHHFGRYLWECLCGADGPIVDSVTEAARGWADHVALMAAES